MKYSLLSSLCIPAQKEPVLTKTGDCQPLIKLERPFCEYYGFKIDKYVSAPVWKQQDFNDQLWAGQATAYKLAKYQNISYSNKCSHQYRYFACHQYFQGCDCSTSVFQKKRICKESCLEFVGQCNVLAKMWTEVFDWDNKHGEIHSPDCSERPTRRAGNTPECAFYARNKNTRKEGNLVWCLLGRSVMGCRFHNQFYGQTVSQIVI